MKLSVLSKAMRDKSRDHVMDGVWAMHSYSHFMSKTGFTGVRNINLFEYDSLMKDMQQEINAIKVRSRREQTAILHKWCVFSFLMGGVATPILIALQVDFNYFDFDLRIILSPLSFAWASLIIVALVIYKTAKRDFLEIQSMR